MRWKARPRHEYKPVFLWLPIKVDDQWYWLERCWRRDRGYFTEYVFSPSAPESERSDASQKERTHETR